jgi:hypothetical protein
VSAWRHEVEAAALATPLPGFVALLREVEDPSRPVLELRGGRWIATLVYVNSKGLPVWRPPSVNRRRKQRFVLEVEVGLNMAINTRRFLSSGELLVRKARLSLVLARAARRAKRKLKESGWKHPGTGGRPKGIPQRFGKSAGELYHVG